MVRVCMNDEILLYSCNDDNNFIPVMENLIGVDDEVKSQDVFKCPTNYEETSNMRRLRDWCRGNKRGNELHHGKKKYSAIFENWLKFSPVNAESKLCRKLKWMKKHC